MRGVVGKKPPSRLGSVSAGLSKEKRSVSSEVPALRGRAQRTEVERVVEKKEEELNAGVFFKRFAKQGAAGTLA